MKLICTTLGTLLLGATLIGTTLTARAQTQTTAAVTSSVHRYLIERTFPAGALDSLDAAVKAKVNANNARLGVRWLMSYANSTKTKTYCIYEAPNEAAIRKAATANGLPVDSITEVPLTLLPQ